MPSKASRIALDYSQCIFRSGEELMAVFKNKAPWRHHILRVGAVSTLSRNLQLSLLRPRIGQSGVELHIRSGNLRDVLAQLHAHTLDVVLSNPPVRRDADTKWHSHLLDEQPMSLVGLRTRKRAKFRFPEDLLCSPLLLPSLNSNIRVAFDLVLEQLGIRPIIAVEVDDMAMLRLLALEGAGLALVPPVEVRGELDNGTLVERHRVTSIRESFYAITPSTVSRIPCYATC